MRPREQRTGNHEGSAASTSDRDGSATKEMTPRMHFYSIHNSGEQLRRSNEPRKGKRSDRMVGR